VLALASPWEPERVETVEGSCDGVIVRAPRGSGGFGYDPLFIVPELGDRAMAELSEAEKNGVSHRARAVRALRPVLVRLLDERLREVERALG
jgi:XTP/dITP diphosphohydrolase